jgi:hypothetical protein
MERRLLIFQSGGVEAQLLSKLDAQITRLVQTYSLGEAFMYHKIILKYNVEVQPLLFKTGLWPICSGPAALKDGNLSRKCCLCKPS